MHALCFMLVFATWRSLAFSTPATLQPRQTTDCTTTSGNGTCIDTSTCSGTSVPGYCPGAADIECCVVTCKTRSGVGYCDYTSEGCSGGNFVSGYCPGPSNYKCCVTGSIAPSSGTGSPGLDISGTPNASFWSCAAASYDVVAIEGYIQGCAKGGEVDANFVSNYNAAATAGFNRTDAYLFPCTGTQPTGVACKDPATQLNEFLAAIDDNGMTLGYLWLDIEPTSTANGDACNAWNLGANANEELAQEWVAALQGSGRNWGIYANRNQWTTMFASISIDIGSQLPLWAVQDDFTPGVNTVTTFMGGWTSAVAKQYNLDATVCGQGVDLDSFL